MPEFILVINAGSMTTRAAIFDGCREIASEELRHDSDELLACKSIIDQLPLREKAVQSFLNQHADGIALACIACRGVPLKPMKAGTYEVDEHIVDDLRALRVATVHVSVLSVLVAWDISKRLGIKAYFTDPLCVDEFIPEARITGRPEIERKSLWHALNCRAVLRRCCEEQGFCQDEKNFIVVHLGSGITVACFEKGRSIDVCNANSESPFSPERSGTLPFQGLVEFCFDSGMTKKEILSLLQRNSGFKALLGTNDLREVERRVLAGDSQASLVYSAFVYNIAKTIGSYAPCVCGRIDGIIFTGAMAKSSMLIERISERVSFLGNIYVYPGQDEMEALAYGAWKAHSGQYKPLFYEA